MSESSRSNFHCFIPWNIEYDGKLYVQYSGKIPAALLRILLELDRDEWLYYDKFACWGCYPAPVPEKYSSKGISHDFPRSKITLTREEERGKTHVLWEMNLGEPITTPPVYSNGRIFVLTEKRLISLDAQTGKILWEVRAEQGDSPCRCTNILIHEGMIYAVTPDYWLQKVESTSENVVWKYKTQGSHASLWVRGDNIFMLSEGVTCLTTQTGEKLWSIPHIYRVQWFEDKIFFSSFEKYDFFYGLADSDSGEVIWKENPLGMKCPFYDDGILYFGNFKEKELIARDIESVETVWSYHYGKDLELLHVFENRILLLLYDRESHQTTLVFLDESGSIIWEQQSEMEPAVVLREAQAEMVQDQIFLLRNGYVEAFAAEDGEELWLRELRGTSVVTFQVYKDNIYVSANDQVLYCLDFRTGEIMWEYRTVVDIFDWLSPKGVVLYHSFLVLMMM